MLKNHKTLTGVPMNEVQALLDAPLPPEGYKRIPGGGNLTDICPNWTKRILNLVFGTCGMGWGFNFQPEHMDVRFETNAKNKDVPAARVIGQFWYATVTENGRVETQSFPVTGANKNEWGNEGYAMKGAITNAIGTGASMIGFQESVYLGFRDHSNTDGQAEPITLPEFPEEPASPPPPVPVAAPPVSGSASVAPGPQSSQQSAPLAAPQNTTPVEAPPANPSSVKAPAKTVENKVDTPSGAAAANGAGKIADRMNISRKWYTCLSCGEGVCQHATEPMPPACKNCGTVAGEAFVVSPSEEHYNKIQENTRKRLDAADAAEKDLDASLPSGKRELQTLLKDLTNGDRGLLLQALSDAAGKPITRYQDATVGEHQRAVLKLRSPQVAPEQVEAVPAQEEATTPPHSDTEFCCPECNVKLTGLHACPICEAPAFPGVGAYACPIPEAIPERKDLTKQVYALGGKIGCSDLGSIMAEVSQIVGRQVASLAPLADVELINVWRQFAGAARGK